MGMKFVASGWCVLCGRCCFMRLLLFVSQKFWRINSARSDLKEWKIIGATLSSHEKSYQHPQHFHSWRKFELKSSKGETINTVNRRKIWEQENYWRQRVLAVQNLAYRVTNKFCWQWNL